MICQKCGKEISDNLSVCPDCGAKSEETASGTVSKKKSKKIAVVMGAILALAAVAIAIVCIIVPNRAVRVELSEEYSDIERGISFKRPADWSISNSENELVILEAPDGAVSIKVTEYSSKAFDLFTADSEDAKALFSEPYTFVELSDTVLGDIPAKMLVYQTEEESGKKRIVKHFCYESGYNKYSVACSYETPYENAVNEIMASFTADGAAPANTIAPNEIMYNKIPINRLMEYSPDDIKEAFGEPLKGNDRFMLYKNLSFFFGKNSGKIACIHISDTQALSIHVYPNSTLKEIGKLNAANNKSDTLKEELDAEPVVYNMYGISKFEYKLSDYTMFTAYGKSSTPDSAWFLSAKNNADNELCYNGIPVSVLFELSYDDLLNIYGEASKDQNVSSAIYGDFCETLCFASEETAYTFNLVNSKISIIENLSDDFITLNGSKFSEGKDEFIKIFGDPYESYSYDGYNGSLYTISEQVTMDVISDENGNTISIKLESLNNRIPYNVDALSSLINGTSEDVFTTLGTPKYDPHVRDYDVYGIWQYYVYNDELEVDIVTEDPPYAKEIAFLPKCVAKNGETFDKNVYELEAVLGAPDREGYYSDGYYYLDYFFWEHETVLHLEMPGYDEKASLGYISAYREENYYTEPEPEPEPDTYYYSYGTTADGYTIVPGNTVYAKEGLFGLNYAEGYVQSIDGDVATVAWKYIYVNGLWAYSKYELYSTNEIFIGNTYDYYNSDGEKRSTVGVKNKTPINELYAQIPSGETVLNGFALEY